MNELLMWIMFIAGSTCGCLAVIITRRIFRYLIKKKPERIIEIMDKRKTTCFGDPIENPKEMKVENVLMPVPITPVVGIKILNNLGKAGLIPPDTARAIIDIPADGIVKIHVTSLPYDKLLEFGTSFGSVLDGAEIVSHDQAILGRNKKRKKK